MTKENKTPTYMVEFYINEEDEIEIEKRHIYMSGKNKCHDDDLCSDYLEEVINIKELKKNTLYHAYLDTWFEVYNSFDGTEYDGGLTLLNLIEVIPNYKEFINEDVDYIEQKNLEYADSDMYLEYLYHEDNWNWCRSKIEPNITISEFIELVPIIAQHNLKLAHRIIVNTRLEKLLGNLYNEEMAKVERKRMKFKRYLTRTKFNIRHTQKSYIVSNLKNLQLNNNFKEIEILHSTIDNLSNDLLLNNSEEEILEHLILTTQAVTELVENFS